MRLPQEDQEAFRTAQITIDGETFAMCIAPLPDHFELVSSTARLHGYVWERGRKIKDRFLTPHRTLTKEELPGQ